MYCMSCPHCPHCNSQLGNVPPPADADESISDTMRLQAYCRQAGITILPAGLIRDSDAARLMGLASKTLKNRRSMHDPSLPQFEIRAGRALYSLVSIAAWMASS